MRRLKLKNISSTDVHTSYNYPVVKYSINSTNKLSLTSITNNFFNTPKLYSKKLPFYKKSFYKKINSKKIINKSETNKHYKFNVSKFYDRQILRRYKLHTKSRTSNFIYTNTRIQNTSLNVLRKKKLKNLYKKPVNLFYQSYVNLKKNYTSNLEPSMFIKSNYFTSFILRNSGLFILSKFSLQNTFPYKLKSQFKKKLFSFIYPGQSKKNVLIRRKKQVMTRILSNSFKMIKSLDRFSYQLYYQLFNIESYNISKRKLYSTSNSHSSLTFDLNLRNIYYNFDYQTKGTDVSDLYVHSEVRIPRVRFKPGYQRI
jgi:hypothetical protein